MANQESKLANKLESTADATSRKYEQNMRRMADLVSAIRNEEEVIRRGGGEKAIESQHAKKRLTARERIALLIDQGSEFFEIGIYAAFEMYEEWGGAPGAGVVKSHPRAEYRDREPHSHHLPGRFRRSISASAGRRFPRHR